jgi:hypothetical protein
MQTGHGIVNGHWEPSERHSRLLELVRNALEKLTKKESPKAAGEHEHEHDTDQQRQSGERHIAAE